MRILQIEPILIEVVLQETLNFVPYYAMRGVVNFLRHRGVPLDKILMTLNCSEEALNRQQQTFTSSDYFALYQLGMKKLDAVNIGFQHGKVLDLSEWGILGHIVMASDDLRSALAYQKRYQCLMSSLGQAYHQVEQQQVTMRWLSEANTPADIIEQVITAWVSFAFRYTISEQKPIAVHFVHSASADPAQYKEYFGCPVHFDSSFNGVVVDEKSLEVPLISSNKEVLQALCNHAELQLAEKKTQASLLVIRQFIIEQLPETGVPSLQQVAEHLGISTRQLQRKFQKEGTNLTELIEAVRTNLAIAYLTQSDHKLAYVAQMLGYSEQSAFQRAFKRWTGETPQSFRLVTTD